MHRIGFSLVELSIVLVILGLLTGGILAGQSLIRASELRAIGNDFSKYKSAVFAFRDKYFALPGDMPNATAFWGDQATGTSACASGATPDGTPGTCNGNGNGQIQLFQESARAWQQLAFAGIIEGQYLGLADGYGYPMVAGVDIPASKIPQVGFLMMYGTQGSANSEIGFSFLPDVSYHWIYAGRQSTSWPSGHFLKNEEAWNIDTKLDDGMPASGEIRAGHRSSCSNSALNPAPPYYISDTQGNMCRLAMKLGI